MGRTDSRLRAVTWVVAGSVLASTYVLAVPAVASAVVPAATVPVESFERADVQSAQVAARELGHKIVVSSETTEDSQTLVNPDGSLSRVQVAGPVRVRRGDGWVDVDTTLRSGPTGITPVAAVGGLVLSAGGGTASAPPVVASLTDPVGGSALVAVKWPGRLPAPDVTGDTALYRDVVAGVDLSVTALRDGYKDSIVVRDPVVASRTPVWRLPLKTVGLTPSQAPDGTLRFTDVQGKAVIVTAPAVMWDAQRDPGTGDPVRFGAITTKLVTVAGGGQELQLTPEAGWLTSPATQYPVTIDPSSHVGWVNDHWVSANYTTGAAVANSSASPTEVRAGYYAGGTTKHRGYITFDTSSVAGQYINSADLAMYQWNAISGTCPTAGTRVYGLAQSYTDATTWPGPTVYPTLEASNLSCAQNAWYHYDVTGLVKKWAAGSQPNYGMLLRSGDEAQTVAFWRFWGGSSTDVHLPQLTVNYNRPPSTPYSLTPAQGGWVNTLTPTLSGIVTDPDGQQVAGRFYVKNSGGSYVTNGFLGPFAPNSSRVAYTVEAGKLTDGQTYTWQMRGEDGLDYTALVPPTTGLSFTVDTTAPPSGSTITSGTWTQNAWTSSLLTGGFAVSNTAGDINAFAYRLDGGARLSVPATSGSGTISNITPGPGWHTLTVQAVDRAGNLSPASTFSFGQQAGLTGPAGGSQTDRYVTLTADGPSSATSVSFQVAAAGTTTFTDLPNSEVTLSGVATGMPVVASASGGRASGPANLVWDAATTLTRLGAAGGKGPIAVQAVFSNGGGTVATTPTSTLTVDPLGSNAESTGAGPGSVNLLTGDLTVGASDASVAAYGTSLSVGRTFHSLAPGAGTAPGATGTDVFGPGWVSSLPGGDNSGVRELRHLGGAVTLVDDAGGLTSYVKTGSLWVGTGDAATDGSALTEGTAGTYGPTSFTLTTEDGTLTVFAPATAFAAVSSTSVPHLYRVSGVTTPGSSQTTQVGYDATTGRVSTVYAPVPAGVSCPSPTVPGATWNLGCRGMSLSYDGSNRLTSVKVTVGTGGAPTQIETACYSYDGNGRLSQQWDPRVGATGTCAAGAVLPTAYTYDVGGRLATVTPAGLAGWTFGYDTSTLARLRTVTRAHAGGGSEVTTVVYNVDVNAGGSSLLADTDETKPDLSTLSVARWGQTAPPVTATAVYGPGDGNTDLRNADITAMDAQGRAINTASFSGTGQRGWRISGTSFDSLGNSIRSLSARQRDVALWPDSTTTEQLSLPLGTDSVSMAARAGMLETTNLYSSDGTDLLDTYGPLHLVTLPDGSTAAARGHTSTTYGTGGGALSTGGPLHSPLTVTVSASRSGQASPTNETDARVTKMAYALDDNSGSYDEGWIFHTPVKISTVMADSSLVSRITRYDRTTGAVTKVQQPMANTPLASTAGVTVTSYYTTGTQNIAGCVNNAWVNLPCKTSPAAQPGTSGLPNLPVKQVTNYDALLRPTQVTETVTGSSFPARVTTTTYEGTSNLGPRVTKVAVTGGQGTAVPDVTTAYDSSTGLPLTQANGSTITTGYDDFGRVTSYTDADSDTTITSYDPNTGRVYQVTGTKTTLTYGYNAGTEHRGLPTSLMSSVISTSSSFTAAYDADGSITSQTAPDGLTSTWTYDPTGDATKLSWTRSSVELMRDTQSSDIHGQWRTHGGYASGQTYSYDNLGRLTQTDDIVGNVSGNACTRRSYAFDLNSNRTSSISTPAPAGTTDCTGTAGTPPPSHTYDAADRLLASGTDTGLVYDNWGRTTTLPAASSGQATPTTIGYYSTDLVANMSQNGSTRSWNLDAAGRRRTMTDQAAATTVSHYGSGDDNPAWIKEPGGSNTIYTSGLAGNLAASTTGTSTTYQLSNLHGDIAVTTTAGTNTLGASLEADEYGTPRGTTARYGWLGGKQRSSDDLGGIVLMGVRLYSPVLGRFLQTDPVPGGSANNYDYANQDPINQLDLDGRWPHFHHWKALAKFAIGAVALAACGGICLAAGIIAGAWSAYDTGRDAYHHRWGRMGGDLLDFAPGAGRAFAGLKAARYASKANKLRRLNLHQAASEARRSRAVWQGRYHSNSWRKAGSAVYGFQTVHEMHGWDD
ncbi:MAG: repeat protein [Frankiales bacterium]|nr:repeat protein [Frankiales bacterium]